MAKKKIADFFSRDEILREVDPKWTKQQLLEQNGLFRYSKVATILDIDQQKFRKYLANLDEGEAMDRFGITKAGQLRVRMKVFRKQANWILREFPNRGPVRKVYVDEGMPHSFERFPKDIKRADFFELKGIYQLKAVTQTGYLPYTERNIIMMVTQRGKERLDPYTCGVWKAPKFYLVDFETFIVWIYSRYRRISLEKARATLLRKRE